MEEIILDTHIVLSPKWAHTHPNGGTEFLNAFGGGKKYKANKMVKKLYNNKRPLNIITTEILTAK